MNTAGACFAIGERFIAFWSVWDSTNNLNFFAVLGGLITFKVAAKWDVWKVIGLWTKEMEKEMPHVQRIVYGAWLYERFVIGTILNVGLGFIIALLALHYK